MWIRVKNRLMRVKTFQFFQAELFPSAVFSWGFFSVILRAMENNGFPPSVTPALSSDARPQGSDPGAVRWKPLIAVSKWTENY